MYNNICTGDMDQVKDKQKKELFESTCLDLDVDIIFFPLSPITLILLVMNALVSFVGNYFIECMSR